MTDPHTAEDTGRCCSGIGAHTPRAVANRPGLPEIAYRSGVHGDFRASMLAALSAADRPGLARLRTRDDSDPTIALIDAWAVTCDVLTFYTERLANESYLRTATERASLRELGRIVAYRPAPGVAAETHLAFSVERPPAVPAALPADPGLRPPTTPTQVMIPAGLRVQSVPGPGQRPQTFETVEALAARADWNALPLTPTRPYRPANGRTDAWFAGAALAVQPGDAVLFVSEDVAKDTWDVRLVTRTEPDPPADRTHVHWDQPLAHATAPEVFVLHRRIPVFGHNAPVWKAMNKEFRQGYASVYAPDDKAAPEGLEWPFFGAVREAGTTGERVVDLAGSHPDVVVGSWVVLSQEGATPYQGLCEVKGRTELSRGEFAVAGTVTRLTLRGAAAADGTPRQVTVLAVAEPLTVIEAPDNGPVRERTFDIEGQAADMLPGRRLVLSGRPADGPEQAQVVTLDSAEALGAGRTRITLTADPYPGYARASAVLFGNVAPATHGETVHQILGDGDARRPFQTMPLLQGPLTHVRADTPRGTASTLSVQVDGVAWRETRSLYGAGPDERVFSTRTEPGGRLVAAFGDGAHGARLPSGSHNVRATHRKGIGAEGNLDPGQLSQLLDRPLGVRAATNPQAATGGVDPEDERHARASIPLATRTLGRAVSVRDYADFALAFAGISLAEANLLRLRTGRTVVVTVCGPDATPAPEPIVSHLAAALREFGDPQARLWVLPARPVPFRLALKVRAERGRKAGTVAAAVESALRAVYAAGTRPLAAPVHRSEVVAVAASVPGVVSVDLDLLYRDAPASNRRLPAAPASVDAAGEPVAAELLVLAERPFDWLEETS